MVLCNGQTFIPVRRIDPNIYRQALSTNQNNTNNNSSGDKQNNILEVYYVRYTGQYYFNYVEYVKHIMYYNRRQFECELSNRPRLTYFEALQSERAILDILLSRISSKSTMALKQLANSGDSQSPNENPYSSIDHHDNRSHDFVSKLYSEYYTLRKGDRVIYRKQTSQIEGTVIDIVPQTNNHTTICMFGKDLPLANNNETIITYKVDINMLSLKNEIGFEPSLSTFKNLYKYMQIKRNLENISAVVTPPPPQFFIPLEKTSEQIKTSPKKPIVIIPNTTTTTHTKKKKSPLTNTPIKKENIKRETTITNVSSKKKQSKKYDKDQKLTEDIKLLNRHVCLKSILQPTKILNIDDTTMQVLLFTSTFKSVVNMDSLYEFKFKENYSYKELHSIVSNLTVCLLNCILNELKITKQIVVPNNNKSLQKTTLCETNKGIPNSSNSTIYNYHAVEFENQCSLGTKKNILETKYKRLANWRKTDIPITDSKLLIVLWGILNQLTNNNSLTKRQHILDSITNTIKDNKNAYSLHMFVEEELQNSSESTGGFCMLETVQILIELSLKTSLIKYSIIDYTDENIEFKKDINRLRKEIRNLEASNSSYTTRPSSRTSSGRLSIKRKKSLDKKDIFNLLEDSDNKNNNILNKLQKELRTLEKREKTNIVCQAQYLGKDKFLNDYYFIPKELNSSKEILVLIRIVCNNTSYLIKDFGLNPKFKNTQLINNNILSIEQKKKLESSQSKSPFWGVYEGCTEITRLMKSLNTKGQREHILFNTLSKIMDAL